MTVQARGHLQRVGGVEMVFDHRHAPACAGRGSGALQYCLGGGNTEWQADRHPVPAPTQGFWMLEPRS